MKRATAQWCWFKRILDAVWQTIRAPQWGLLLLVVALGLMSNAEAAWLATFMGLLIAAVLCLWALTALGYDGGNPIRFFFTFHWTSWSRYGLTILLLILAVSLINVTARSGYFAGWLLSKIPSALAPKPDQSLTVVFLACIGFTAFSIIALLIRRMSLHRTKQNPLEQMNRKERRANRVSTSDYEDFKAQRRAALERYDYWTEASLVLGLAAIAIVPGALGWTWLWGVTLSIVLPMLVLSVRFRMRDQGDQRDRNASARRA
ncbi:hypothetical protein [Glutamicibacter sp. ZJUTW]|uniref:hypothetical protein n=1 Tax=Glutamicibacter sp. ZJUTW TaxID=1155384 RepID=UPI0011F22971|nr:hypothetical protein [Glutamicibacter sp. ZJUTW]QEP06374.1 hypothetical protein F0M17_03500 [Glutamicibacter sp. ZJUTW]